MVIQIAPWSNDPLRTGHRHTCTFFFFLFLRGLLLLTEPLSSSLSLSLARRLLCLIEEIEPRCAFFAVPGCPCVCVCWYEAFFFFFLRVLKAGRPFWGKFCLECLLFGRGTSSFQRGPEYIFTRERSFCGYRQGASINRVLSPWARIDLFDFSKILTSRGERVQTHCRPKTMDYLHL